MLEYLINFSACLAIFMVFYKLFLERENMHHLKRYYLLATILIALSIPLITFTTYVEPVITTNVTKFETLPEFKMTQEIVDEPTTNYLPIILWSLYGFGVVLFCIKFILNLFKIVRKIQRNPKHKTPHFTHVLLLDLITPHTFFNYIFLNKDQFETQQIPKEVFIHEEAHAKQKHSIDVLFIELLQIIFWFNPLIYLAKRSIKMNHEFLADDAVLKQGIEPSNYQQLLLTFSSNDNETDLANAINYSSIKKRFTVMKTHTSKQKIWLRSFLLLPLIALTLYGFSEKKEVFREVTNENIKNDTIQGIVIYINENEDVFLNKNLIKLDNLQEAISKLNTNLTKEQKKSFQSAHIQYEDEKSQETLKKIHTILLKSDLSSWSTVNLNAVKNSELKSTLPNNKYAGKTIEEAKAIYENETIDLSPPKVKDPNSPWQIEVGVTAVTFTEVDDEKTKGVTQEMIEEYNAIVNDINSKPIDKKIIKQKDFDRLIFIFNQMSDDQMKSAFPLSKIFNNQWSDEAPSKATNENSPWQIGVGVSEVTLDSDNTIDQQKATPEEVAEYNRLAKHSNAELEMNPPIIKVKEVKRIEYLYGKMSKDQKKNAEPYPDFSKVPPPPAPATGFIEVNGETLFVVYYVPKRYYNKKGYLVDKNGKPLNGNTQVNASDVLPGQYITKVYQNDKVVVEFKDNIPNQKLATPEEVEWYNNLIQETNKKPEKQRILKQKDIVKLKAIYQKMSEQQKTSAEAFPKFPTMKTKEQVMLNGKKSKDGIFEMTKEGLSDIELSIEKGSITEFKFKVPGKKTLYIKGVRLNEDAKALIKETASGSGAQLFDIKSSNIEVHPPIFVEIK